MMLEHRSGSTTIRRDEGSRDQIDAMYASERLRLQFAGILPVDY